MGEWYWVLMFALVGGSFLIGRWCGIRDFEKALKDMETLKDALDAVEDTRDERSRKT